MNCKNYNLKLVILSERIKNKLMKKSFYAEDYQLNNRLQIIANGTSAEQLLLTTLRFPPTKKGFIAKISFALLYFLMYIIKNYF